VKHSKGIFITFEGVEGSGKSTQIFLLRDALISLGHEVICTREPGGTLLAEKVRTLLVNGEDLPFLSPRAELLLFEACRAQHVDELISPALCRGSIVLCDRYIDSSAVYQGVARALGKEQVEELNNFATDHLIPDLTLVLDLDLKLALDRARSRNLAAPLNENRFENEAMEFHEIVRKGFLNLIQENPKRFRLIPAAGSTEEISKLIRREVSTLIPTLKKERLK